MTKILNKKLISKKNTTAPELRKRNTLLNNANLASTQISPKNSKELKI